jgi:hypothetical protein
MGDDEIEISPDNNEMLLIDHITISEGEAQFDSHADGVISLNAKGFTAVNMDEERDVYLLLNDHAWADLKISVMKQMVKDEIQQRVIMRAVSQSEGIEELIQTILDRKLKAGDN